MSGNVQSLFESIFYFTYMSRMYVNCCLFAVLQVTMQTASVVMHSTIVRKIIYARDLSNFSDKSIQ